MKLLSYNVLAQSTVDHLLREGVSAEYLTREHRTPLVSNVLTDSDADIICLQEVDDIAYDDYFLKLRDRYDGALEKHKRQFGNACFWKRDLSARSESVSFQDASGRVAQKISFKNVDIYNVHLDFKLNISQAEKLVDWCNDSRSNIVCGDFNASPTSKSLRKFKNAGFTTFDTDFTIIREETKTIDFILARNLVLKSVKCVSKPEPKLISVLSTLYQAISGNAVNYFPNKNEGSDHIALLSEFD